LHCGFPANATPVSPERAASDASICRSRGMGPVLGGSKGRFSRVSLSKCRIGLTGRSRLVRPGWARRFTRFLCRSPPNIGGWRQFLRAHWRPALLDRPPGKRCSTLRIPTSYSALQRFIWCHCWAAAEHRRSMQLRAIVTARLSATMKVDMLRAIGWAPTDPRRTPILRRRLIHVFRL
jgi:hypothetical protein